MAIFIIPEAILAIHENLLGIFFSIEIPQKFKKYIAMVRLYFNPNALTF